MKITTKYNPGDFVYTIQQGGYDEFIDCPTCDGNGVVNVNNTERVIKCPDCYGRGGSKEWRPSKWFVQSLSSGVIGKITVEIYDKKYNNGEKKFSYMLNSTGVGSGTVWSEDRLFLNLSEAESECDKLNDINSNVDERPSRISIGGK